MILSLSAFTNSPLQGHTAIPLVVTSGDQEELAIWTEGYVQGDKAHKIISKFIHVYGPALQGGRSRIRGGRELNGVGLEGRLTRRIFSVDTL